MGEESPALTHVARTHARRPLYSSATGKTLLANVPDDEMYRLLDLAAPEQAGDVRQFLAELPEIHATGLAFNRGASFAEVFVRRHAPFATDRRARRSDQRCCRALGSRSSRRRRRGAQDRGCRARTALRVQPLVLIDHVRTLPTCEPSTVRERSAGPTAEHRVDSRNEFFAAPSRVGGRAEPCSS